MTAPFNARIHGNGFLQLDLPDGDRMHLWDERLPRQRINTAIHNHRFSFISTVLRGTLINVALNWHATVLHHLATHRLYTPERTLDSENTILVPTGLAGTFFAGSSSIVHPGDQYQFAAGRFHTSHHLGTTVTRMTKTRNGRGIPTLIACRIDEEPDNDFHRDTAPIPDWAWDVLAPYLPAQMKGAA